VPCRGENGLKKIIINKHLVGIFRTNEIKGHMTKTRSMVPDLFTYTPSQWRAMLGPPPLLLVRNHRHINKYLCVECFRFSNHMGMVCLNIILISITLLDKCEVGRGLAGDYGFFFSYHSRVPCDSLVFLLTDNLFSYFCKQPSLPTVP